MKLVYLIPLLFLVITPAFAYNSGFRPVYQPSGAGGSNPTELYCTFGEFLNSYNSTTNSFTCAAGGGGGENNTASSSGVGYSLVLPKVGVDLPFRGIFCAGDLLCSSNATDIRIEYTASSVSIALNDLTDVIISGATYPSVLFYNGAEWVNRIFSINTQTSTAGNFITGIDNQTGVITTQTFKGDTTTCSGTDKFSAYDNQTGDYTCTTDNGGSGGFDTIASSPQTTATILADNSTITNTATIKTLTSGQGITLTNGSNAVTVATNFKLDTTTCSSQFVSAIDNATGDVTCTTASGGSGIPLPPKKWGELIPRSASTSLQGLLTGCSILATASFVYDTTDNSNAILSTTATTDGINGGIHCSVANTNSFRGDQNAYLYAKWEANKITTNRIFIGFQSGATHLPNNADTILDALDGAGLCIRTTDTIYQFCSNDGTGATAYATMTTTEDTGVHYVEIYTTNAGVTWCGKLDGGTAVCSSTAADIPTPTDRLYVNSTGETDGGASAILWTQYLLYVQSDK